MLLNRAEFLLMNNPVRAAIQRGLEARLLLKYGGSVEGGRALEIGCGRGVGIEAILNTFGASQVDAFDLDPRMVEAAQHRHRAQPEKVQVWQGSATSIDRLDDTYDAVFDFGVIHHIPEWRDGVREVSRVLKPGGRFYAEEVFARLINGFPIRQLFVHPREDRFDSSGFISALEAVGFRVVRTEELWGWFGWFVAEKDPNVTVL